MRKNKEARNAYLREYSQRRMKDPAYREAKNTYARKYMAEYRQRPYVHAARKQRQYTYAQTYRLRHRYGLSIEEASALLSEGCAICGASNDLVIDHIHNGTPNMRGVLCRQCNISIARFNDDPVLLQAAIAYLNRG